MDSDDFFSTRARELSKEYGKGVPACKRAARRPSDPACLEPVAPLAVVADNGTPETGGE